MKRNIGLYLDDILECIRRIDSSTQNLSREQFENDIDIQDAIIRRIEIIGEAVKHLPQDFKENYPNVPWKEIAGTRDVFIHDYIDVNLDRVWNIIQNDLKPLKDHVQKMLQDLDDQ